MRLFRDMTERRLTLVVTAIEVKVKPWRATLSTTDGTDRQWIEAGEDAGAATMAAYGRYCVDREIDAAFVQSRAVRPLVGMPATISVNGEEYAARVEGVFGSTEVRVSTPASPIGWTMFTRRKDGSYQERGTKFGEGAAVRFGKATTNVAGEG